MYSCVAFSCMRWRTRGQKEPFVLLFGESFVVCLGVCSASSLTRACGLVWLLRVSRFMLPLMTASASSAFVFISSSRSLLVQNHISSGVAFSMYRVPFWISVCVCALFMRAAASPIL